MAILTQLARYGAACLLTLGLSVPAWAADGLIEQPASAARTFASARVMRTPLFAAQVGSGPRVTTAGIVYLPDGTAAAPPLAFASEPGLGAYRYAANKLGFVSAAYSASVPIIGIGAAFYLGATAELNWSSTTDAFGAADLKLTREASATLQMGSDAAGVTNQMFKGPDRITSDGVGGHLFLGGGRPRGASRGGAVALQSAPPAAAAAAGTLQTVFTADYQNIMAMESFHQPHMVVKNDFTAKALTDGSVNVVFGSPSGIVNYREEQDKTASSWVNTTTGLDISADNTIDDEGVEIYLGNGADTTTGWHIARGSTGACFTVNFTIALIAGTDQFVIGWRQNEAWRDDNVYTGYADWSVVGINNVDGSIFSEGEVAGGGTLQDDSGVNAANGDTRTLKVCLAETTGVPTAYYTTNGSPTFVPITMTNSGTAKTAGIQMNPLISYQQAGGAIDAGIKINWWAITRP